MSMPIFQHPSLVALVDDSSSFLQSLAFQLDRRLPRKKFDNASVALEWIRQESSCSARPQAFFSSNIDTYPRPSRQHAVALEVEQIYQISFRERRFMTPTVVVVDYEMPQMNGIEFCTALQDMPCKRILLTGTADENIAVAAFNRGLIHRYIRKGDDDSLDRLQADIHALQRDYFQEQSNPLGGYLALRGYEFLTDPRFEALLHEVCSKYQIVEYYLYPNPSGVLLYDRDGRAWLLVIQTEPDMEAHYEVAWDNQAPAALLSALAERQVVPYFFDGDGMYSSTVGEDWRRYSLPARVCHGREVYYWAVFDLAPDALAGSVRSFEDFMRTNLST